MSEEPDFVAPEPDAMTPSDVARLRGHVDAEMRDAATYRLLAAQVQGRPRDVLLELADGEEGHARQFAQLLDELGEDGSMTAPAPRLRARLLAAFVRRQGIEVAIPFLERQEAGESDRYAVEAFMPAGLRSEEDEHASAVASLAPRWRTRAAGTVRAAVFGVSDGVVSNLALILGLVGAGATQQVIVTAGLAGLLAGAMSMAAGEYVSVASQRELLEADGETGEAIDAVGSANMAAATSFGTFAVGATVPLIAFLFATGLVPTLISIVLSAALLAGIGASLALFTNRPLWWAAGRQVGLGLGAGAATMALGALIGIAV